MGGHGRTYTLPWGRNVLGRELNTSWSQVGYIFFFLRQDLNIAQASLKLYVAKDSLERVALLSSPPTCWGYRHAPLNTVDGVLRIYLGLHAC